ncbi:MAG: ABC transporter permease [Lachnospiraceae bacterium]|nr:ABC transporter permease [Lachnospiraceae bacterium]
MKAVLKVAKKALPSASIYFGIFCAIMFVFTFFAGKDQEKNFQATELTIYVDDADDSVLSRTLIEYLGSENKITTEFDKEMVSEYLFNGYTDYVLYFEEGFEAGFFAGKEGGIERQSIRANVAFVDQKIEMFFRYVRAELALGKNMEDACGAVLKNCEKQAKVGVVSVSKGGIMGMVPGYYLLSYLAYILPAVLIMILGPMMHAFYKKDVKMRTDCGMVSVRKQNLAVVAGVAIVASVVWALLMVLGALVYHKDFTVGTFLCGMLNSLLFLLVSIGIAVLSGVLVKGVDALNGANNLISMGMAFTCGVFVPADFLPEGVNKFAEFLPASWYMKNVRMLFEEGEMVDNMRKFFENCGVIAIFSVAIFCVFLVVVKRKRVA